jgi:plasmid stabilization system protein ParE
MRPWRLTSLAEAELFDIWRFVAKDNVAAADKLQAAIVSSCDLLSAAPFAGMTRPELTALPLRFWLVQPYANYFIAYYPETKPIQIVRILHTARDLRALFV